MGNSQIMLWEQLSVEERQRVIAMLVQMLIHYLAQVQEVENDREREQNSD
jgi:predicted Fe-S protein YdhL (DUF1289 family)